MSNTDAMSEDLFYKLRNRFPNIQMGDDEGKVTTDPKEARFFNLVYEHDKQKWGKITVSVVDPQSLKIYFSQDITAEMDEHQQANWFQFLRELRRFAKSNLMMFDVRDITKSHLNQADINFASKQQKEKSAMQESIAWERRGRFSEGNHKSIKIHVVHTNKLDENPNNRLVGIDKIYLVNENKERFLLPFVSISGAKAMAMHVAHGGTPYDSDGQTIIKAVNEMKNLSRFGSALRNKTFESEEPMKVVRASKLIKEQIKRNLQRMQGHRNFEEGLAGLRGLFSADSQDKTEVLKDWFIQKTYNESLDVWLESATNALRRAMEQNLDLNTDLHEEEDKMDYSDAILDKDQTDKRAANPAQIGDHLELYADDDKDREMYHLIKTQPMRGMVRLILADIASRAVDDEVAILASRADAGDFTSKHKKMIEVYLKDMFGGHPPRVHPEAKKDLYGKKKTAEEEFESAIMGIGEEDFEEAIGNKHKKERFKSIKKVKNRFKEEEMEEDAVPTPPSRPVPTPPARPKDDDEDDEARELGKTGMKTVQERSMSRAAKGHEKYGKEGMQALAAAGQDGASEEEMDKIRDRYNKYDESMMEDDMEAGTCNESPAGTMCPVHGMEECSGSMMSMEEDEMNESIRELQRLAGLLNEQDTTSYPSSAPDHSNPIQQALDAMNAMSPAARNAQTARNAAAEREFYNNNPHLKGDEDSMQKLRDAGQLNFNPGTLSKTFDDPVDQAAADRAARLQKAMKEKHDQDAEAHTNWMIDQIKSKPAWTPPKEGEMPWPTNKSQTQPQQDQSQPQAQFEPKNEPTAPKQDTAPKSSGDSNKGPSWMYQKPQQRSDAGDTDSDSEKKTDTADSGDTGSDNKEKTAASESLDAIRRLAGI
jgi:hypothetical protein